MTDSQPNPAARLWALVPAAGSGSRMQSAIPKQYLPLAGKPVLDHTLVVLLSAPGLAGLVVAINADDPHFGHLSVAADQRVLAVTGGAERADSVMAGLAALSQKARSQDWVLVHDAARPCLSADLLADFVRAMAATDTGGILAVPVADTLKRVQGQQITVTVDRSALWAAQTPQMFRYGALKQALTDALAAGLPVTDEASAMERAGHTPRVYEGAPTNLKITRPQDLALAELILRSQQDR